MNSIPLSKRVNKYEEGKKSIRHSSARSIYLQECQEPLSYASNCESQARVFIKWRLMYPTYVRSRLRCSQSAVSCQLYASRIRVLWIVIKLFHLVLIYWPLNNFLCEILNNLRGGRDKFISQAIDIPQKGIFLRII
jgi:hypothetical protein